MRWSGFLTRTQGKQWVVGSATWLIILVLNYRVAWWAIPSDSSDVDSSNGKRSHLVSCCGWQMVCPLYPPLHSTLTTARRRGHHYFFHKWGCEHVEGLIHVGTVPALVSRRGRWLWSRSCAPAVRLPCLPVMASTSVQWWTVGLVSLAGVWAAAGSVPTQPCTLWNSEQLLSWF